MLDVTASSVTYKGGEEQSVFPIPFPFLESSHIRASTRNPSGGSRALAAGIDFSINHISDEHGELILLGSPLAENHTLTITRLVPLTQDILFHNQGPNSPRATETAADKLTMIAQQLDARLDACLSAPDGVSSDELSQEIADNAQKMAELHQEVNSVKTALTGKAPAKHSHEISEIESLPQKLAEKADKISLIAKADLTQLAEKSDRDHTHPLSTITGLAAALTQKVDTDDPRLSAAAAPTTHAKTHSLDGEDAIRPEDIGALPAPPADGNKYLAVAGGWVQYIPPENTGGNGNENEGGTLDHSQLLNRDAADQHPQSAIQNLPRDLESIRQDLLSLADADENFSDAFTSALAVKADKTELPALATADMSGLLSASDKRKLDTLSPTASALPAGGSPGDFLQRDVIGDAAWQTPAAAAGCLPLMGPSQKGVARLASDGGLELDAGGALRIAAEHLLSKTGVETKLSGHTSRLDAVDLQLAGMNALSVRIGSVETNLTSIDGRVSTLSGNYNALGTLSRAADAPSDGKLYLRKNGAWTEYQEPAASGGGGDSSGGGAILGEIRLLPFRKANLPTGWYFCNGDQFALTSAQGIALSNLPAQMKTDWGITVSGSNIKLPNLFTGSDGYFFRAVNGSSRNPGNKQSDAIRNITGTFTLSPTYGSAVTGTTHGSSTFSGALYCTGFNKKIGAYGYNYGVDTVGDLGFDASKCTPTSTEIRPINVGMTPAIYLGV